MFKCLLRVALAAAPLMIPVSLAAQREARDNVNHWTSWFLEIPIDDRWRIEADISFRRSGPQEEWQQILARAGLHYVFTSGVRTGGGYVRSEAYPFGKLPSAARSPEHRTFQQVVLNHSASRVQFVHRIRVEQRWQGRQARTVAGKLDWVYTNRARYLARATVPLQGDTFDPGEWGITFSEEVFLNWGTNVQSNVLDQNRLQLVLSRRLNRVVRLDLGFLEQMVQKPNGRELERNHTLMTLITTSF